MPSRTSLLVLLEPVLVGVSPPGVFHPVVGSAVGLQRAELVADVHHPLVAWGDSKVVKDIARLLKARLRRAACTTLSAKLPLAPLDLVALSLLPCLQELDSALRPLADSEDRLVGSQLVVEVPPQLVALEDKASADKDRILHKVLELVASEAAFLLVRASPLAPAADSHSQAVAFHQGQLVDSLVDRGLHSLCPRLSRPLCLLLRLVLKLLVETWSLSRLDFVWAVGGVGVDCFLFTP